MEFLKKNSIRNKLIAIIFTVTFFSLATGFIIIALNASDIFHKEQFNNALLNTDLLSKNCVSPLIFKDKSGIHDIINASLEINWIDGIIVFDEQNQPFSLKIKNYNYERHFTEVYSDTIYEVNNYFFVFKPIVYKKKKLGTVFLIANQEYVREKIGDFIVTLNLIFLLILILSYFISLRLQKIISEPILKLAKITHKISREGNYSFRAKKDSDDEIGILYDRFNFMLEKIEERQIEVDKTMSLFKESEEKIRAIFNQTFQFITLLNNSGKIIEFNHAFLDELKIDRQNILHKFIWEIFWEADQLKKQEEIKAFIADAKCGKFVRFEMNVNKNNKELFFDFSIKPIYENNKVKFLILEGRDITDRKIAENEIIKLNAELEMRVKKRTEVLKNINKELEAFSYSVSHDLRAPLRSIDGLSQALLEDYSDKLDEQGKDYLKRVRNASQKMSDLIDDILKLSRINKNELSIEKVNISELANEIVMELTRAFKKRDVLIENIFIEKNMFAFCDKKLMKIALENLIENAFKYTSKNIERIIEINVKFNENGENIFYVKDNGVGFNMKFADKVFSAFQRLHSQNEFEGTGIGLATVKRILNRHHGRIWVESKEGQGTTFYFTLN